MDSRWGEVKETLEDLAVRNKQLTSHTSFRVRYNDLGVRREVGRILSHRDAPVTFLGSKGQTHKYWDGKRRMGFFPVGHLLGRVDMAVRSVQNSYYHTTKALEVVRNTGFDKFNRFYRNAGFRKGGSDCKSPR